MRIIVTGLIAQYPLGGVTWDYIQWVLGLHELGHEVYYLEDTGQWPYNPLEGGVAKTCDYNVRYLAGVMSRFGLSDRWAYRFPWQSQWFGLSSTRRNELLQSADLLINVSGSLAHPERFRDLCTMVYIDTDPVFTQVKLARGQTNFRRSVDAHDVHFSFGECLSQAVPSTGHDWRPTRQPIVLSQWAPAPSHGDAFTTVMNWTSYQSVAYAGQTYGQKDVEFERFIDLPSLLQTTTLQVAINAGKTRRTPWELLRHKGWRVVDASKVCPDLDRYRSYIESSKAEWSVAKNGYVMGFPGWFSCRSACYLATAKPVVVQDTGFGEVLPTGEGILAFRTLDEAVDAVHDIEDNYERHSLAARAIAEDYFDSSKVLKRVIDDALAGCVDKVTAT